MKELQRKLELFYYATNIPIRLYDGEHNLVAGYLLPSQEMPDFLHFHEIEQDFLQAGKDTFYYTNDFNEHYFSFSFDYNGIPCKVAAGPTVDGAFDRKFLLKLVTDKKLKLSNFNRLEAYFQSLPRVTSFALRRAEPLLRYLICGTVLDLEEFLRRESSPAAAEEVNPRTGEVQRYHHSSHKDALMVEAVKNGDREKFYSLLLTPGDGPEGILCKNDPVRSYKNQFIVSVTYITKAAIEGGVDSESAYTLSDGYIQTVEEIVFYEQVTELFIRMANSFLELVEKANKKRYTGPVYRAVEYINKHYYGKVTVKELAARVHLSESHLLRLFREQTQKSIKDFILDKRINEVKNLLRYTEHSISAICEMTGFSDQSYMTNQFRKLTGTTPKRFRELS